MSLFNWKLKKEELNNQIDNYHTLKWAKSYRKISAMLVWLSIVITLVLAMFTDLVTGDMIAVVLLVYLPISIFVYNGHRWALWLVIVFWTIDKFYMLSQSTSGGVVQLIWWAIYMSVFIGALQVENARSKIAKLSEAEVKKEHIKKTNFCSRCGTKMDDDSKFCFKCGTKVTTFDK